MNKYTDNIVEKMILMAYVASIMLFSYAEGQSFITKIVALVLVALFVYRIVVKRDTVHFQREWIFLIGWFLFAFLSIFVAVDQRVSISRLMTLLQVLPVSFVLFSLLIWVRSTNAVWIACILTLILISIITLQNPAQYSDFGRLRGTFNNSNLFGLALLVTITSLIYYLIVTKSMLLKIVTAVLILFFFYMITESGSRKALVAVLMIFMLFGYFVFKNTLRSNIIASFMIVVVAISATVGGAIYIKQSKHYERIERIFTAIEEDDLSKAGGSEAGRLMLYERGLEVITANPMLGIGLDNFRNLPGLGFGQTIGTYSHSNVIEVAVSTGVLGLFLYYSIYLSIGLRLYKIKIKTLKYNDSIHYIMISSLLAVYFVYDFAMVSYYEKVNWLFLSAIMAAVYNIERKSREGINIVEPDAKESEQNNSLDKYESVTLR